MMDEQLWVVVIEYEPNKHREFTDTQMLYFQKRKQANDYGKRIRKAMDKGQKDFDVDTSGIELSGVQYLSLKGVRSIRVIPQTTDWLVLDSLDDLEESKIDNL
ncbi:MAG: hypothetical protein Q4A55_06140 [Aerococcus sp.]|nr:hypothetical protein [Aerococcus sp.]